MTERTQVHRAPHKQIFEVEVARAIIARAIVAHITITHLDGLVLARSSFQSSMHYQSLMALGRARLEDVASDLESDVWAGAVPLNIAYGAPGAAENLRPPIAVPSYINNFPAR